MEMEKENRHIEPESSLFFKYIRNKASDAENEFIDAWLKENEENEKTLLQTARIFYEYRKNERIAGRDSLLAFDRVQKRIKGRIRKFWLKKFYVAAACLVGVIIMSSGLSYWKDTTITPMPQLITVQANAGMRTSLNLPDGTIAYLNSGSTLSYPVPYDKEERRVALTGEAYFKVAHDVDHPFVVSVSNDQMRVKVLGTEFNLQAYAEEGEIQTTLVNGLVSLEFRNKSGKVLEQKLIPSEKAIYNLLAGEVNIQKVNTLYDTAWMDGKLMFKDSPLPDVLKKLSYFYNVTFEVKDKIMESYCFTGTFKDKQLSQVLEYLKISSNVDYRIDQVTKDDSEKVERTRVVLWKRVKNKIY